VIFEPSLIHEISGPNPGKVTKPSGYKFESNALRMTVSSAGTFLKYFWKGTVVASRCDKENLLEMMPDGFAQTC
jgi:hypothetical protein